MPAVVWHQLVKEGKIGRIFHVRCQYLQEWGQTSTPLLWGSRRNTRVQARMATLTPTSLTWPGFVTGDEIVEVSGAIAEKFVKERTIPSAVSAGGIIAARMGSAKKARWMWTTPCCFLVRFKVARWAALRPRGWPPGI